MVDGRERPAPLSPWNPQPPAKKMLGRWPTPESGRWWHGLQARFLGRPCWEHVSGRPLAIFLESGNCRTRSQAANRDGRGCALAERSNNGHLRRGRSPRKFLAGKWEGWREKDTLCQGGNLAPGARKGRGRRTILPCHRRLPQVWVVASPVCHSHQRLVSDGSDQADMRVCRARW
jgi:hypothetical protein